MKIPTQKGEHSCKLSCPSNEKRELHRVSSLAHNLNLSNYLLIYVDMRILIDKALKHFYVLRKFNII